MNLKHIVISESITKSNIPRISSCGKSGAWTKRTNGNEQKTKRNNVSVHVGYCNYCL